MKARHKTYGYNEIHTFYFVLHTSFVLTFADYGSAILTVFEDKESVIYYKSYKNNSELVS
ncbi:MAG: hypothetical protein ACO1OT_07185 [Heyndrickxia sp.]